MTEGPVPSACGLQLTGQIPGWAPEREPTLSLIILPEMGSGSLFQVSRCSIVGEHAHWAYDRGLGSGTRMATRRLGGSPIPGIEG
jgi:hypothetical protein